ncbi:TPA: hypothetical protein RTH03_000734 [Campylobacter jejuni]|nr:hypothetical protein [Campylobacter jejuni]HDZ5087027.1 hypothetical protein [Campylobacter jejuni]HDZ5090286.1 hypothetical protein [Campylobacter jejuni]HDZ5091890.1 hypothetical protein [Campylobacter jejuni]HDZ5099951.1 hypothetical protein [Campylobacter jejuni]
MDKLSMNDFNVSLPSSQNITNRKEILELKKEEQEKVKVNDISDNQISGFKVVFENKQGELMALKISDENYKNLQSHFDSYTNYIARDDGTIRLNGEANEFIANWFEKISGEFFNPNSLNNKEESNHINVKFHKNTLFESMQNLAFKSENELSQDANLQTRLNFAMKKDVNFDGNVNEFDVKKESLTEILRDMKNTIDGGLDATKIIDPQKSDDEVKAKRKKDEKDLLEIAKEKGLSALSADEQAKLKASNPQIFEELQDKSLGNLEQNLKKDLILQISNNEAIFVDKKV